MYLVFWMYLGVCLLLATRGTPRLYGSHRKALRRVANPKMYFVETGRAPCRKGKTLEGMQIARTMIDSQLYVPPRLLIFAGDTRHAASLPAPTKGLRGLLAQKMYFVETGRAPCRKGKTLERMQIV